MSNSFIQISDSHIDDEKLVMGVNSHSNLNSVIEDISKQSYDALVFSGDLAHNGTIYSYIQISEMLRNINKSVSILSGNHDKKSNLSKIFGDSMMLNLKLKDWEIITVDSVQYGKVSGRLSIQKLKKLTNEIELSNAKYIVICMHHPVMSMESSWDDEMSLENPEDFFASIYNYDKVKAVIWGHAHQCGEFYRDNLKLFSCPSTAVQFCGPTGIGYNHYKLYDDGEITCKTRWL